MALQSSGQISLSDIQTEFGGSNPISLSEYYGAESSLPTSGQIAMNQFYGLSDVTAPVWNSSTKTFDLGTPDTIQTKTSTFTLSQSGAVAIIAIGGGGAGGSSADASQIRTTGGGGGGVAIKGFIGTSGASYSVSRGSGGLDIDHYQNPYWDGPGRPGGATTVSGSSVSLTANGGTGGVFRDKDTMRLAVVVLAAAMLTTQVVLVHIIMATMQVLAAAVQVVVILPQVLVAIYLAAHPLCELVGLHLT
jgi:hypothetical protein